MAAFNYNHLYYFYVTAKMGGVTAAARKLHTSQSSLSSQLKILEGTLDMQLFLKSGRRLELTDRGEAVLAHCEKIFSAAETLDSFVQTVTGDSSPVIRCGTSKDIGRSFLGRVMGQVFLGNSGKNTPRVRMEANLESDLATHLQMRELEVAITSESIPADGIQFVRRINLPVALFGSVKIAKSFPSKDISMMTVFEQTDLGLALPPPGSQFRQETETYMATLGLKKRISLEGKCMDTLFGAVDDSFALTFAPICYAPLNPAPNCGVQILGPSPCWNHQIFLYAHSEKQGQSVVSAIESVVKQLSN